MKKITLIFALLYSAFCFSQQKNRYNGYFLNAGLGFVQYEKENAFKSNASMYLFSLGKEFYLGNNFSLLSGIAVSNIYGNYTVNQEEYFFTSKFITIPINFRLYSSTNAESAFFGGLGLDNKFKFYDKSENVSQGKIIKEKNGYHLGASIELGYRTKIHDEVDFLIGINHKGDILQAGYKSNKNKIVGNTNIFITLEIFKKDK